MGRKAKGVVGEILPNGKRLIRKAGTKGNALLWEYRCTCGRKHVADYHIIARYEGCVECRVVGNQHTPMQPGDVLGGFEVTGPHIDHIYLCRCRTCGRESMMPVRGMRWSQKCEACRTDG